jgi:hypothetical protein
VRSGIPATELEAVPTLADSALAHRPAAIVVVVVLWCGTGLAIAWLVARRGHEFRHAGPLGLVFGPLLLGLLTATLRPQEETAKPVVVRPARTLGGNQRVLVAVIGDPSQIVDALPVLRFTAQHIAQVEIARPVTFDVARAGPDDGDRVEAARELEEAALFLEDLQPGLVLVPGRGVDAVTRYIDERDADIVIVVGDDDAQAQLCRGQGRRTAAVMVGHKPDHAGSSR